MYDGYSGQTGVWHGWWPMCGGAHRFHRPFLRLGPRWWCVGVMWYRDFLGWASQANRWRGVIYTMPVLMGWCCGLDAIRCVIVFFGQAFFAWKPVAHDGPLCPLVCVALGRRNMMSRRIAVCAWRGRGRQAVAVCNRCIHHFFGVVLVGIGAHWPGRVDRRTTPSSKSKSCIHQITRVKTFAITLAPLMQMCRISIVVHRADYTKPSPLLWPH